MPETSLVIDASVGLKWALDEPDSQWAEALARSDEELLVPDFWLHEATNVCWLHAAASGPGAGSHGGPFPPP